MTTYVLVPGYWLGGWAWSTVAARLSAAGHQAYPVTLTGLGERAHLGGPDVHLETHVLDIVNTLAYAELRDVVLVAHSGGGLPVTGAADRVPERISRVVYVDSGPFPDGACYVDTADPADWKRSELRIRDEGDGWGLPLPSWAELGGEGEANIAGLSEEDRAMIVGRATPQPLATMTGRLQLRNDLAREALPHTLVTCTFPLKQVRAMIERNHPYFAAFGGKEWTFHELPTGHWPMFSATDRLADLLGELG